MGDRDFGLLIAVRSLLPGLCLISFRKPKKQSRKIERGSNVVSLVFSFGTAKQKQKQKTERKKRRGGNKKKAVHCRYDGGGWMDTYDFLRSGGGVYSLPDYITQLQYDRRIVLLWEGTKSVVRYGSHPCTVR